MKLAGSTPPSRQPGHFPSDAFFLLAPCCGFSWGKQKNKNKKNKNRGVWPRERRGEQWGRGAGLHPPTHGGHGELCWATSSPPASVRPRVQPRVRKEPQAGRWGLSATLR